MGFTVEYAGFGGFGVGTDLSLFDGVSFEDMGKKALKEVMPDMVDATKSAIRSSVQHPGDSDLVNSIKCFEPSMTRDNEGVKLVCQPTGRSKSGNRYKTTSHGKTRNHLVYNNDKAFWLEYGVAGRQPAHPWKDRALNNAEARVFPKVQNIIEKELGAE